MAEKEGKKKRKKELKAQKKAAAEAKEGEKSDKNDQQTAATPSGGGVLQWIVMAVVIAISSGSGFTLGRLFAGSRASGDPNALVQEPPKKKHKQEKTGPTAEQQEVWHYEELEPVIANPDVPGSTRYVRVVLILEMSGELDKTEGMKFLNAKKHALINWLNIYLKSLTLEELRGDKNMKRIQSRILDAFNEQLWPDSKPKIKKVLLKEFAIQ